MSVEAQNSKPLVLSKFTKYYGKARGVEDIDLELEQGEVLGFLGPNGAGKTTTIRAILNFMYPTSGKISIFGLDSRAESKAIKERVGYLAGDAALYENMTGYELFTYLNSFYKNVSKDYIDGLVKRFSAQPEKKIKNLSKGNKQKIALIQAVMHQPDLLFLDEPTSGLDPLNQQEFYQIISDLKKDGITVFVSSHNLAEVQRICDRAGFIRDGKLVAVEQVNTLNTLSLHQYKIEFTEQVDIHFFDDISGIESKEIKDNIALITMSGSIDPLIKKLAQMTVVNLDEIETSLEEVFLHHYETDTTK